MMVLLLENQLAETKAVLSVRLTVATMAVPWEKQMVEWMGKMKVRSLEMMTVGSKEHLLVALLVVQMAGKWVQLMGTMKVVLKDFQMDLMKERMLEFQ